MELLKNTEVLCLLTMMFILLTITSSGFISMLWGACAIGTTGIIWYHEINRDIDDEDL